MEHFNEYKLIYSGVLSLILLLIWWFIRTQFFHDYMTSRKLDEKVLLKAIDIHRKESLKKRKDQTFYAVALAFNDLHCHRNDLKWMCPKCNKVHTPYTSGWEFMTGIHYPRCCNIEEGHRLFYEHHATTANTKHEEY